MHKVSETQREITQNMKWSGGPRALHRLSGSKNDEERPNVVWLGARDAHELLVLVCHRSLWTGGYP